MVFRSKREVADGAPDVGGVGEGHPSQPHVGDDPEPQPTNAPHRSGGDDASKQGMRRPVTTDATCHHIAVDDTGNLVVGWSSQVRPGKTALASWMPYGSQTR